MPIARRGVLLPLPHCLLCHCAISRAALPVSERCVLAAAAEWVIPLLVLQPRSVAEEVQTAHRCAGRAQPQALCLLGEVSCAVLAQS